MYFVVFGVDFGVFGGMLGKIGAKIRRNFSGYRLMPPTLLVPSCGGMVDFE